MSLHDVDLRFYDWGRLITPNFFVCSSLFLSVRSCLQVSQVYRDRSIGNPINIIVVKIAFLETDEVRATLILYFLLNNYVSGEIVVLQLSSLLS